MKKFRLAAIVAIAAIMSLVAVTVISGEAGSQTTDPSDPNRGLNEPVGPEAPGGDDAVGTDDRDNGGDGGGALDQVIGDDLIVDGSICAGFDCVNGESFGFDTLRLKENNLRIRFDDTSSTASFPRNDWQITINDTTNGGASKFSIDDITGGRTPFTIEAAAPSHSLFVDDGGRIGFGTSTPVVELHVKDGDSPTIRLEQDGSSGFTAQTWDMAGNETNFFIRDVTNGSRLPFRIRPNAPTNSIFIDVDGDVGMNSSNPAASLDVRGAGDPEIILAHGTGSAGAIVLDTPDGAGNFGEFVFKRGGDAVWSFGSDNSRFYIYNYETNTYVMSIDRATNVCTGTAC